MFTSLEFNQTVTIRNKAYSIKELGSIYSVELATLANEYFKDQNCWPDTFINEYTHLSELEKASFIYHCQINVAYGKKPVK